MKKMEKHLQECKLQHAHDKTKTSERKGVAVRTRKKLINAEDMKIIIDKGLENEGSCFRSKEMKSLDKPFLIWRIHALVKLKERTKWIEDLGK